MNVVIDETTTARNERGRSALHYAAQRGLEDVCLALLNVPDFTAVNSATDDGSTALHYAAEVGFLRSCAPLASVHFCQRF